MPFTPRRLLIAYDDSRGLCGAVVPRMKQMLEERAFVVDVAVIGGEAPDISAYHGLIVGAPVLWGGVRPSVVPPAVCAFLDGLSDLDEKKVAVFSVFSVLPGTMVEALHAKVVGLGAEVVASYAYWRIRPEGGEHVIPAECMIRVR